MRPLPLPAAPRLILSFDFDGTLHYPDHRPCVNPQIFEVLRRMREEHGALWAVNTGRSLMHTLEGLNDGDFPFMPDFCIAREQEIFRPNELGRCVAFGDWNEKGRKVHDRLFKKSRPLLMKIKEYVLKNTRAEYVTVKDDPAGLISSSEAEMEEICEVIDPWLTEIPELSYERNSIYLRFAHRDYHKGSTLQEVARHFGLGAEHCFAIGDGPNDFGMLDLEVASRIACPANAAPMVRQRVDELGGFVCREEASQGVLEALAHFFPLEADHAEEVEIIRLEVES